MHKKREEKVISRVIVFDTTASNTDLKKGVCTFTENSIEQELAWLACCYHVHGTSTCCCYSYLFGPTRGPNVAVLKRLQQL